jgi:hypothetical protein
MKEENFAQAAKIAAALRAEVAKAMVGQREVIDAVLCALLAGGHVPRRRARPGQDLPGARPWRAASPARSAASSSPPISCRPT